MVAPNKDDVPADRKPDPEQIPWWPRPELSKDASAIGLVLSGYSADDPDGRAAILNITLHAERVPIPSGKPEELGPSEGAWLLDIELPSNPGEAARLRDSAGLPRQVSDLTTSQPITLRWIGVDGPILHNWLTDETEGLRFLFRREGEAVNLQFHEFYYSPAQDLLTRPDVVKDLSATTHKGIELLNVE